MLLVLRERIEDEPGKAALVAARLGDDRHVGRRRAGEADRWRRETVRWSAGALDRFALVIDAVLHLVLGRNRRRLRRRKIRSARLREIAKREQLHAVAGLADLAVDLVAALELTAVEFPERT